MKKALFLLITLFSMSHTILRAQHNNRGNLNQKSLPDVTVKDLNGKDINVGDYSKNGKITIISFWATWCAPCKKELNNISGFYHEWVEDYDIEIVAISIDDSRNAANVKSYVKSRNWGFVVLLDTNQELKRAMNFQTIPYTVVTDKNGYIDFTHTGYVEGDEYVLEDHIIELSNK